MFPRQGHYALDPEVLGKHPPADLTIERIGDLHGIDMPARFRMALPRSLSA